MGKDCDHYSECKRQKLFRRLFACILSFIILILFVILIIWLILRPTKPKFYLRDVSLSQFNMTEPNLLTTSLQVTISSRNPNDRIGIYYDWADVYAEYKDQRITVPTSLPTGYQGHNDFAIWSPFLYGSGIPVAPYLSEAMGQDEHAGLFLLNIKVDGRLRWKVGSWISGHYHLFVNCPAFMIVDGSGYRFQQMTTCGVDV